MPGFNDFLASQAPGQMVGGQVAPQAGLLDRVFAGLLGTPSNYGGLLSPEAVRDAQRQQRIALGAQLLQAGGPQQHPVSFGQALGSAVQAGNQAGYVANDQQLKSALLQRQMQSQEASALQEQQRWYQEQEQKKQQLAQAQANYEATQQFELEKIKQQQGFTSAENDRSRTAAERLEQLKERFAATQASNAQTFKAEQDARAALNKPMNAQQADATNKMSFVNAAKGSIGKVQNSSDALGGFFGQLKTGPLAGRRPAGPMTDKEGVFEADVAALLNQIVGATKVPGTGSQSDADAERLNQLTPRLIDDPAARNRKIKGLESWLSEIESAQSTILGGTGDWAIEKVNE